MMYSGALGCAAFVSISQKLPGLHACITAPTHRGNSSVSGLNPCWRAISLAASCCFSIGGIALVCSAFVVMTCLSPDNEIKAICNVVEFVILAVGSLDFRAFAKHLRVTIRRSEPVFLLHLDNATC